MKVTTQVTRIAILFVTSACADRTPSTETPAASKSSAVRESRFVFSNGVPVFAIPFPERGVCAGHGVIVNPYALEILKLLVDGQPVRPLVIYGNDFFALAGVVHGIGDYVYVLRGIHVESSGAPPNPDAPTEEGILSFTIPHDGPHVLAEELEIHYRVHCVGYDPPDVLVTHGWRSDIVLKADEARLFPTTRPTR